MRVVSLRQLKALKIDRRGCIFVEFSDLFAVGIAAYRLRECGQEVVAHFQVIALAFETRVDKPQISPLSNFWVGALLCASEAHLKFELKTSLVVD